jgi:hypothetical protein
VKSEVERCFQQNFGPLQRELANALAQLHDANTTSAGTQQASAQPAATTQPASAPLSAAASNVTGNATRQADTVAQPGTPPAA